MSWIKIKNLYLTILIFLNLIIIFFSNLFEPGSKAVLISSLIIVSLTFPMIIYVFFKKIEVLAINTAFLATFLIIMEGLFFFKIIEHPAIPTWKIKLKNIETVELLDNSPYVKFKPNVKVTSQGSRGSDFTYEWVTDQLGFKNILNNDISKLHFNFIALGDSFTEAIGVEIIDTWTSKVGQKSTLKIYNAGVQGYTASQMRSTYESLVSKISHDGIIIATLPRIYRREAIFINSNDRKYGSGGIRTIAKNTSLNQSFLTGLLRALKRSLNTKDIKFENERNLLSPYVDEIPAKYPKGEILKNNRNWELYIKNLIALSEIALSNNKKVILIQYPYRHEIYFNNKELGVKNISEVDYYVELDLIRDALSRNVEVIDMFKYLKNNWKESGEFIYFLQDGHMNEKGQEQIADFMIQILEFVKEKKIEIVDR
tara:strand:- start:234 stop:1514 length:1281 start_codon:yes stop_codon:yes gene_type:complete